MLPRCFIPLCCVLIFAVALTHANSEEYLDLETSALDITNENEINPRNPALVVAMAILRQAFKWAAKHCLKEAAHHCKQHWKHPKALVSCGKRFLQANKGRCVIG